MMKVLKIIERCIIVNSIYLLTECPFLEYETHSKRCRCNIDFTEKEDEFDKNRTIVFKTCPLEEVSNE